MLHARSQKSPSTSRESLSFCVACAFVSLALVGLWNLVTYSWSPSTNSDTWQPRKLLEAPPTAVTSQLQPDSQPGSIANASKEASPPILVIYEQYHGVNAWRHLHKDTSVYRGLCQSASQARPGGSDIDAPNLHELLRETYYQNLLCEYGGFFALAANMGSLQAATPWLGFQSWEAADKKVALSSPALRKVMAAVSSEEHGEALYFWAQKGGGNPLAIDSRFFWSCDKWHAGNCSSIYGQVFRGLHRPAAGSGGALPAMPEDGKSWAHMSYWIMPRRQFLAYVAYARMFFVVLDALWYDQHHDKGFCPLDVGCGYCPKGTPANYLWSHCWCFLLERLVNIWAYHTGLRMVYVDPASGQMAEYHALGRRDRKAEWFSASALAKLERSFPALAATFPRGLLLHKRLGWNVMQPLISAF